MNMLGILNFQAPYLPWVLMGFSVLINNIWPKNDLIGIAIGHTYYFFDEIYPSMPGSGGVKYLSCPSFFKKLFIRVQSNSNEAVPLTDANNEDEQETPGGFGWGDNE
jgi:hypothetical protein